MAQTVTLAFATETLTCTGQPTDGQTVIIGAKTYTFQTTLTDSDGNVDIGANTAGSIDNLYAAMTLGSGAGTAYAASMTAHPSVEATSETDTTLVISAMVPGTIGNEIAVSGTYPGGANAAWAGSALANGSGDISTWLTQLMALNQINAEVLFELKKLTTAAD